MRLKIADTQAMMTVDQLVELLKGVFLSPKVIGVTIVIILYVNVVMYVVSYRKRPPRQAPRRKRTPAAAPTAAPEDASGDGAEAKNQ